MSAKLGDLPSAGTHLDVEVRVVDLSAYDAVFGTGEVTTVAWPNKATLRAGR
ncbi:hypothetical protein [Mycobacterium marinum]|uniref:hypothetical protein n=1 Tax=Mycobacterium marinum TaxID=1781 RepID=UPI001595FD61|nr:hypothetical protein [Mycobacterium marinum]